MIYIEKHEEPEWLAEFKQNNPQATYDLKEFKPYISRLNEVLVKEQKHLCAYCCGKIDTNKSHNEHIEPRNPGKYASNKSLDYRNIVASCYGFQGDKTCGMKKANDYDETQFISPLNPACENVFKYLPNGKMEGDTYTIDLLNLNSYRLRKAREAVYNTLAELDENTIKLIYSESEEVLAPFMNVIKWYLKNELPSNKE